MAYGLTNQGFIIKRLIDIQEELKADFRSILGDGINLDDNSPLGQIIGILAERESLIWELMLSVYNSQYPDTAEGVSLDNCGAIVGIPRLEPSKSVAVIRARGTQGTLINKDSIVAVEGNTDVKFSTDNDATILAPTNCIQKILFSEEPESGTWIIDFEGESTSSLDYDASNSEIETALELLDGIEDVTVSGDYIIGITIEFINADGLKQQSEFEIDSSLFAGINPVDVEVEMIDEGGAYVDIPCTALEVGANQAPAMTLTVIETLISGWDESYNLLDADVGRDEETDEEYRLRRFTSLQQSRAATVEAIRNELKKLDNVVDAVVFENDTLETDIYGRPPKSFEAVIEGGDDDDIAETIWYVKPAGIQTYGTESKTITDSQGIEHTMYFSRPTEIDIYVDITVTKKTGGEVTVEQVKDAIMEYASNLILGDDVIVYPDFIASLVNLEIIDIVLDIGTTPSPSGDDNIIIEPDEKAKFDTDNINVTIV